MTHRYLAFNTSQCLPVKIVGVGASLQMANIAPRVRFEPTLLAIPGTASYGLTYLGSLKPVTYPDLVVYVTFRLAMSMQPTTYSCHTGIFISLLHVYIVIVHR